MIDEGSERERSGGLAVIAERHGVSVDAVRHLLRALEAGHGTMAQFDHPDLGGMGQWFSGGMVMVGRMFDADLKARVSSLCNALSGALPRAGWDGGNATAAASAPDAWYPAELGWPATTGAQNGLRYAYFPQTRRLAIESASGLALYDTGEHHITGASQSNGTLRFSSVHGHVDLAALKRVDGPAPEPAPAAPAAAAEPPAATEPRPAPGPARVGDDPAEILATLERLADLHGKGILTEAEFAQKKAELLSRL
ncbi:SHOCT domain-containing protein [Methylobacterium planeticum]|uniref:SHOCT domain-containing protein n=1 Tax=Methylobacterium planeticum TaxID=2615211 RepID=A0A6N6MWI6_9HYPH|nr:SHOCT domain-containing protein [Methylobacterium planeticum]KAB1075046.1 SHOCT domain-containing protein [Methylobacterium planeticum]